MATILFVLDIGFDRNGPSVHLLQDILRAGLRRGHRIDVILKKTGGPNEEMPEEFRNHPLFRYFIVEETDRKRSGFLGRYISEILYAGKCKRLISREQKYDAVFLQSNPTAIFYMSFLKKKDCRIIFNVQDIFPYNLMLSGQLPLSRLIFPIFRKLQNIAYLSADQIITISDDMKQTLVDDGVASDRIEVIYNWSYADTPITLDQLEPDNICDLQLDPAQFNVIYAGNIGKMQNVESIAQAARDMQDDAGVHFYIIGGGANLPHIESMVKGLPNVTMLPMQPARFAESIYAQADLNLIPLVHGGIRTALPSKTATVLRIDRPVLFCIDRDSIFSSMVESSDRIVVADVREVGGVKAAIEKIRSSNARQPGPADEKIRALMSVNNADRYIDCIARNCHDA